VKLDGEGGKIRIKLENATDIFYAVEDEHDVMY